MFKEVKILLKMKIEEMADFYSLLIYQVLISIN